MADGFTRATGKNVHDDRGKNGPGITNFVTAVKTAYWKPPRLYFWFTPQAANKKQSVKAASKRWRQMKPVLLTVFAYQEEVRDPTRIAENAKIA